MPDQEEPPETPDSPEAPASDAPLELSPAPKPPKPASELQFDRAELPAAKKCSACKRQIGEDYYKINAKMVCAKCHSQIQEKYTGGSGVERFLKASLFGTIAAGLGAGLYYAILAATGYELALISILVGVMVGHGVKKGCDGRGGWVYQTLAIFLTYTAIATAYVPVVIGQFAQQRAGKSPTRTATSTSTSISTSTSTVVNPAKLKPIPAPESGSESDADPEPEPQPVTPAKTRSPNALAQTTLGLIMLIFIAIAFFFALPILSGIQSIIGLVIIGVGLYEAWKINKRVVLNITGPIPLNSADAPAVGPVARARGGVKRASLGG